MVTANDDVVLLCWQVGVLAADDPVAGCGDDPDFDLVRHMEPIHITIGLGGHLSEDGTEPAEKQRKRMRDMGAGVRRGQHDHATDVRLLVFRKHLADDYPTETMRDKMHTVNRAAVNNTPHLAAEGCCMVGDCFSHTRISPIVNRVSSSAQMAS